jgi:hypothetical protein
MIKHEIINCGTEKNIMVFDENANSLEITKKLLYNMIKWCPQIDTIIIPDESYPKFLENAFDHQEDFITEIKFFGRQIITDLELNHNRSLTRYYVSVLKCSFPIRKKSLVLGFCSKDPVSTNNVILGCC